MEYKVGQKVRVVGPLNELKNNHSNGIIGKVYIITAVEEDRCYLCFANWHWFDTIAPVDVPYIGGE